MTRERHGDSNIIVGWFRYLSDGNEGLALKLAPLAVGGYAPFAIINEATGIGVIDDLPTLAVGAIIAGMHIKKANEHRSNLMYGPPR